MLYEQVLPSKVRRYLSIFLLFPLERSDSCATCDGFLYRDRDVIVVGGGDTAMEDALVLARTSKTVTIVHRGSTFHRASHALSSRVLKHPKIKILWNTVVIKFLGGDESDGGDVGGVVLRTKTKESEGKASTTELNIGAAFIAIGHDPNTKFF